jgi:hypothetical protein
MNNSYANIKNNFAKALKIKNEQELNQLLENWVCNLIINNIDKIANDLVIKEINIYCYDIRFI